jgi:peptidoglycan/LPS O-acetylase OafA/YrhL
MMPGRAACPALRLVFRVVCMVRSIEGLRGLAALLVALFHAYVYGRWGGLAGQWPVLQHAWLFVDLFFVVSGYVMASAYGGRLASSASLQAFMVRRFFRLYPLHLVTTFAVIATALAVQTAKWLLAQRGIVMGGVKPFAVPFFDADYLGLEILLLHGVGIVQRELHNYPSWSISVEFWMYLLFAVAMLLVRADRARMLLGAGIVTACIAWIAAGWSGAPAAAVTLDVQGMPRGLLSFFLGVLVHHGWLRLRATGLGGGLVRRPLVLGAVQLAAALLALALVARQPQLGIGQLVIPFAFALLVLVLLPDHGIVARGLQTRPLQWLGLHSYAIYLTHVTVQTVLDWPGRSLPEPAKHLIGLAFLATVLGLSALCYRFIEVPWRERGRRIAARIEAREAAAGPVGLGIGGVPRAR